MLNDHQREVWAKLPRGGWREMVHKLVPSLKAIPAVVMILGALSACASDVTRHGHIFTEAEIKQVRQGMSRDQVKVLLGTPDTQSTIGDGAYYYISTTKNRPIGLFAPRVIDRKVLAVYFDKSNSVKRVAHYGLQDGKVIDLITSKTPSYGSEDGLLKELFRNIGRPTAAAPSGN